MNKLLSNQIFTYIKKRKKSHSLSLLERVKMNIKGKQLKNGICLKIVLLKCETHEFCTSDFAKLCLNILDFRPTLL